MVKGLVVGHSVFAVKHDNYFTSTSVKQFVYHDAHSQQIAEQKDALCVVHLKIVLKIDRKSFL